MLIHHHALSFLYYPVKLVKNLRRGFGIDGSNSLRVLLYHDIAPNEYTRFSKQLRWLAQSWKFVTPDHFNRMMSGSEPIIGKNLLLTFDDGFFSNREIAEQILNPLEISALFFVVPDFVDIQNKIEAKQFIARKIYTGKAIEDLPDHWDNMGWNDLEMLLEQGHSLGCHTKSHARLVSLNDHELKREIVDSGDKIEQRLGISVEHFAFTFGNIDSFNQQAMSIARNRYRFIHSGIRGDNDRNVSTFAVRRDAAALQNINNNYEVFPNNLLGAFLEGVADPHYRESRAKLDKWASQDEREAINKKNRVIAFYLPQFHPIPENNSWWGEGFTEWTNVAKAKPLYKGHAQPNIPADLGFYDLRLSETREAQAQMAAKYGVEGFCYWHYWFAGRSLLQRPFEEVLSSGVPDFPFCLGWANETWTGVWNGEPSKVLIEQTYPGEVDDKAHFEYLLKAFQDHRYIRVEGKPLLIIYKPLKIPNAKKRMDYWRGLAVKAGLNGLYIVGTNMLDFDDAEKLGLDGAMISTLGVVSTQGKIKNNIMRIFWGVRRRLSLGGPRVIEYEDAIKYLVPDLKKFNFKAYPTVFPNWDHTPRMGRRGVVLANSTPELFEEHMRNAIKEVSAREQEQRIIFLKSWNEWAEGNYLEPDLRWGKSYLEALRRALR